MAGEKRDVRIFEADDELADGLAKYTAEIFRMLAQQKSKFTVVLSGGYLIQKLRKLVEPPYVDEIDWSKWHVFWVDESVVMKDDPDSNYGLA